MQHIPRLPEFRVLFNLSSLYLFSLPPPSTTCHLRKPQRVAKSQEDGESKKTGKRATLDHSVLRSIKISIKWPQYKSSF